MDWDARRIRRIRCGRIVTRGGHLVSVSWRLPMPATMWRVWRHRLLGRGDHDLCRLDYRVPFGAPRLIAIDYMHAGRRSGYPSFRRAVEVLDRIAETRNAIAIVAHVTNDLLTDRLMRRMGYERHGKRLDGRHYIRRFYDRT